MNSDAVERLKEAMLEYHKITTDEHGHCRIYTNDGLQLFEISRHLRIWEADMLELIQELEVKNG